MDFRKHLIHKDKSVKEALFMLNNLAADAILFVVSENDKLIGSLTDGDIRRGFIKGLGFDDSLLSFIQPDPVFIYQQKYSLEDIASYRLGNLKVIPILNDQHVVINILNLRVKKSLLPVNAIIMAGGRGQRLMPLTEHCPKPLLKVGNKPIIEHNIDRLSRYGINNIAISINYLGGMVEDYFKDGSQKNINISYIREAVPMGTIGAVKSISVFDKDELLIMNSDLLTDIDFADFYSSFKTSGADMAVATTSYHVDIPYGVLEINHDNTVKSLREKPSYTYYSNAGIYILKKELLHLIPDGYFDITDLIHKVLERKFKLITYPILGYWLDIGKMQDYHKAQEDIKHLKL